MFSVAQLNGLIAKVKKGKYNFVKPGTEDLIDESIENFKEEEFADVIKKHPKMKEMIKEYITKGSFYTKDADVEDESAVDAETGDEGKKKKDSKEEEKDTTKKVDSGEWTEAGKEKSKEASDPVTDTTIKEETKTEEVVEQAEDKKLKRKKRNKE
jgi:hypothetical protein